MPNDITPNDGILNTAYENALLGFILVDPDKMLEVSEILPTPEYFTQSQNRTAWEIFLKLFREDRFPGSPALMISELHMGAKAQFPTEMEAAGYVNRLLNAPTTEAKKFNPKSFVEYAEYIKWERDKKKLTTIADEIKAAATTTAVADKEEFVSSIEDQIAEITMNVHGKDSLLHISEITEPLESQLARLRRGEKLGGGVMTGIDMLDKTLNGLKGGEMCVLAARPAMGKSIIYNSLILKKSKNGKPVLTPLYNIEVGDYVYNRHGKPVEVLGVYPQGKLDAYELTFSDGRTAICSADHIWPYWQRLHRSEQIGNITLEQMLEKGIYHIKPSEKDDPTRRNRSRFSMPINDAVEFPEQNHKISPYIMGAFLGDGCKNSEGYFELSSELEYHAAQIANMLGCKGYRKQSKSYSWHFYKEPYVEGEKNKKLHVWDIDPAYAELLSNTYCGDKYIPEEYLFDSIENRWELLRGLMDTDGTIFKQPWRHPITFNTTSEQLAYDFRSLCNSLGLIAHIATNDRRGQTHKSQNGTEYIRKSIEYNVSILVPNEMKPKFFTVEHKLARAREAAAHGATRGAKYDRIQLKKVEKLPQQEEMVCIMVDDPEHLYLCNDFLVTHNTTLSMQVAYNVAQTQTDGKPNAVLIFSLEMMEDQLMSRMVATSGRINMKSFMEEYEHLIDDGYYARAYSKSFEDKMRQKLDTQFQRAEIALDYVKQLPIYTTTEPGMSPNSIKSLVMQKKREIEKKGEKLALIVIDYLQLMVPALSKQNASRTEEVGDMSRKMKLLAKEFDVPVLLLAQLNRNADVTERPNLKDLRESGSIEQDADKVMFIWSEHSDKSPSDFSEYREDAARVEALRREQQKVTISVAKNRQGESGDVPVIFDKGFQTFVSQSDEYAANNEQYEEFAAKYYQKTRTDDIFWPLRPGEIPEEMERFRNPVIREIPYLTPDGKMITMANENEGGRGSMTIQSNIITPATQSTSPQSANDAMYDEGSYGQLDRSMPAPLPEIDDLSTGFEEIGDEDEPAMPDVITADNIDEVPFDDDDPDAPMSEHDEGGSSDDDIEMDDDDMDIDLDSLDLLDALSDELES